MGLCTLYLHQTTNNNNNNNIYVCVYRSVYIFTSQISHQCTFFFLRDNLCLGHDTVCHKQQTKKKRTLPFFFACPHRRVQDMSNVHAQRPRDKTEYRRKPSKQITTVSKVRGLCGVHDNTTEYHHTHTHTIGTAKGGKTQESRVVHLEERIAQCQQALSRCQGPEDILKSKVLARDLSQLQDELGSLQLQHSSNVDRGQLIFYDAHKHSDERTGARDKTTYTQSRLYPININRHKKHSLESMSLATLQKRRFERSTHMWDSFLRGSTLEPRVDAVDTCITCGVDKSVDKETSHSTCTSCGASERFCGYIFDVTDVEKTETRSSTQKTQSIIHLKKYSAQFERGFPAVPLPVLDRLSAEYNRTRHVMTTSIVNNGKTHQILRSLGSEVPRPHRSAVERVSKEIKCEPIPEFSQQELAEIWKCRSEIVSGGESDQTTVNTKKSFNNQMYMRQFGKSCSLPQSRLFPQAKTNKIHYDRNRSLESDMLSAKAQYRIQQKQYEDV